MEEKSFLETHKVIFDSSAVRSAHSGMKIGAFRVFKTDSSQYCVFGVQGKAHLLRLSDGEIVHSYEIGSVRIMNFVHLPKLKRVVFESGSILRSFDVGGSHKIYEHCEAGNVSSLYNNTYCYTNSIERVGDENIVCFVGKPDKKVGFFDLSSEKIVSVNDISIQARSMKFWKRKMYIGGFGGVDEIDVEYGYTSKQFMKVDYSGYATNGYVYSMNFFETKTGSKYFLYGDLKGHLLIFNVDGVTPETYPIDSKKFLRKFEPCGTMDDGVNSLLVYNNHIIFSTKYATELRCHTFRQDSEQMLGKRENSSSRGTATQIHQCQWVDPNRKEYIICSTLNKITIFRNTIFKPGDSLEIADLMERIDFVRNYDDRIENDERYQCQFKISLSNMEINATKILLC